MNALFEELLARARHAFHAMHALPGAPGAAPPASGPAAEAPGADDPLLAAARRHRVVGLLRAGGDARCAGESWRVAAYGQALHSARCAAEAARVFAALDAAAGPALLVKGPALAAQAWPDPGLRAFDDLDFRCPSDAFPAVCSTLGREGYRPELDDERRRSHYWHFGWGMAFVHPDGFRVEVNHRFFPPQYPWPRRLPSGVGAAPLALDGAVVRAPSPALHLLLSCHHALWHGGERLAWIADIAGLLARHPEAFVLARAVAPGFARRALLAGVGLADSLFGPESVHARPPVSAAERLFLEQLRRDRGVNDAERRWLHRSLLSTFERARYAARRAGTPGDGDFRRLRLPPALRPLYWLYRPLRLARR